MKTRRFTNAKMLPERAIPTLMRSPLKIGRVFTQPYDLVVESLIDQIKGGTIFLRPLSERPGFQRRYVWSNTLASRLVESILLNVPIPPCYLSQNDDYELDVIDGQQRLYSIYRFVDNQFALSGLEVLKDLNGPALPQTHLQNAAATDHPHFASCCHYERIAPRNQVRCFSKAEHQHRSPKCARAKKLCLPRYLE